MWARCLSSRTKGQTRFCTQRHTPKEIETFINWTKERDEPLIYIYDKVRDAHVCLVGTHHYHRLAPKLVREVIRQVGLLRKFLTI